MYPLNTSLVPVIHININTCMQYIRIKHKVLKHRTWQYISTKNIWTLYTWYSICIIKVKVRTNNLSKCTSSSINHLITLNSYDTRSVWKSETGQNMSGLWWVIMMRLLHYKLTIICGKKCRIDTLYEHHRCISRAHDWTKYIIQFFCTLHFFMMKMNTISHKLASTSYKHSC
jgi:hypothetical protein